MVAVCVWSHRTKGWMYKEKDPEMPLFLWSNWTCETHSSKGPLPKCKGDMQLKKVSYYQCWPSTGMLTHMHVYSQVHAIHCAHKHYIIYGTYMYIYMCVRESLSFFPNYDKIQCKSSHYPSVIYFYNLNVNDKDDKQIFKFS